jgi:hypothetical protein
MASHFDVQEQLRSAQRAERAVGNATAKSNNSTLMAMGFKRTRAGAGAVYTTSGQAEGTGDSACTVYMHYVAQHLAQQIREIPCDHGTQWAGIGTLQPAPQAGGQPHQHKNPRSFDDLTVGGKRKA